MTESNDVKGIIEALANLGNEKGFLTYFEINGLLPEDFPLDLMDELFSQLETRGIKLIDEEKRETPKSKSKLARSNEEVYLYDVSNSEVEKSDKEFYRDEISKGELYKLFSKILSETEKSDKRKDKYISTHLHLIADIMRDYSESKPASIEYKDLIQEAYLGLLTAATGYDSMDEDGFTTHAAEWIRYFIGRAIADEERLCSSRVYDIELKRLESKEDFLWKWKDREEEIYIAKVDTGAETDKRSPSELTSISRIQLPSIPDLVRVNPELTSRNVSLLATKTRVGKSNYASRTWTNTGSSFSREQSSDEKDVMLSSGEQWPKAYSQMRFDNDRRLSLYAKLVGERAEEIVIKYLGETLLSNEKDSIRWISKGGEKPGWDIEYVDSDRGLVAIEVKGTTGDSFPNVEITSNEWAAANELRDRYWIYLVSGCFELSPQIQRLQNPVRLQEVGTLQATPILWKIEMISSSAL